MMGIMVHLPNQKPRRVLNCYGPYTREGKYWEDKQVDSYAYDVLLGDYNDAIWSHHHDKLHTRDSYNP